ncbi:kinase-like domain-containing protein [Thelephora terrestris]|uniref:Kinase-like domain-containing protein n=1 Tax=Thelephora terrestris TaxID=56493 RepID=A0A9P6LA46_9AGAM|nr:kinase-like domain-containing protein [Thelephora terrestris]
MATPPLDIQRRLGGLSPSDDEYRGHLLGLLNHRDLKPHIHGLQGNDLKEFVELLDNALNHLPTNDDLFRKTFRRLQSTCSNRGILPSSCLIPDGMLSKSERAVAAGGFADVYQGEFDGKMVCVKVLRLYSQDIGGVTMKAFHREAIVWKRLRHPNVVPFLGVPTKTPPFEIICDWMENGRITEYVEKHPEADRTGLLWDVANGLHYLHSCGIIHGDLKGANILIDKDGHARLTDFGLTSIIRGDDSIRSPQDSAIASTTMWAAPEVLQGGASTKEGDVFTFAMVAVETFTGRPPFLTNTQAALCDIISGKRPQRPVTLSHDGLWKVMQRCWDKDSGKRPTTAELLDFFQTSFPEKRGTSEAQEFPIAPSTWTLAGPELLPNDNAKPRARDTQDVVKPGPQDTVAGGSRAAEPEPTTSADTHQAPIRDEPEPRNPAGISEAGKGNALPPTQINPTSFTKKVKKFLKKFSCF